MKTIPRSALALRWIARIWGILLAVLIFFLFGLPALTAPGGSAALPAIDLLLIGLFALAALGLLLAWRWERTGAWIAILATILQQLLFSFSKDFWDAGQLIQSALFLLPAVFFLLAGRLAKR